MGLTITLIPTALMLSFFLGTFQASSFKLPVNPFRAFSHRAACCADSLRTLGINLSRHLCLQLSLALLEHNATSGPFMRKSVSGFQLGETDRCVDSWLRYRLHSRPTGEAQLGEDGPTESIVASRSTLIPALGLKLLSSFWNSS